MKKNVLKDFKGTPEQEIEALERENERLHKPIERAQERIAENEERIRALRKFNRVAESIAHTTNLDKQDVIAAYSNDRESLVAKFNKMGKARDNTNFWAIETIISSGGGAAMYAMGESHTFTLLFGAMAAVFAGGGLFNHFRKKREQRHIKNDVADHIRQLEHSP